MSEVHLADLRESVADTSAFKTLGDYFTLCGEFLRYKQQARPTRIISPSQTHYIFYQYSETEGHKITRPLNSHLFIESPSQFDAASKRFLRFLTALKEQQAVLAEQEGTRKYRASGEINQVVYTLQQSIGCIGDSFSDSNQARKRIGQLFENLVKLLLIEVGVDCEPRTVNLPVPGYPSYAMSYQLDLVFSRNKAIVASETTFIHPLEVVGSVKTTSKDRIDKIFLDKYLLAKLLERDVPVIAIFLHDVQRARKGNSIFGIASTFKTNHFLGYSVALSKLDGVYYVDPRPEMATNERLREQIHDFQQFLIEDLWLLSSPERTLPLSPDS